MGSSRCASQARKLARRRAHWRALALSNDEPRSGSGFAKYRHGDSKPSVRPTHDPVRLNPAGSGIDGDSARAGRASMGASMGVLLFPGGPDLTATEPPPRAGLMRDSSGWIRTIDLTIMSRALLPLSYGAVGDRV